MQPRRQAQSVVTTTVRMTPDVYEEIGTLATVQGVSRNQMTMDLLKVGLHEYLLMGRLVSGELQESTGGS